MSKTKTIGMDTKSDYKKNQLNAKKKMAKIENNVKNHIGINSYLGFGKVIRETEKAFLVDYDGSPEWFPKSVINDNSFFSGQVLVQDVETLKDIYTDAWEVNFPHWFSYRKPKVGYGF